MNLEYIMLSEISQMEKDKYCMISLICEIKKKKSQSHRNRIELWLPGIGKREERGDVDQTFSYKMNKF